MTMPVGPDRAADVARSPLLGALMPPPATVLIVPSRSIERTRVLAPPSVTSTRRERSTRRLVGSLRLAADAGPPSPAETLIPFPAIVWMSPDGSLRRQGLSPWAAVGP